MQEYKLVSKVFYSIIANIMMFLALFILGYAFFDFIISIFMMGDTSIISVLTSTIMLAIGLIIFNLAKTSLDQEIVFSTSIEKDQLKYKAFTLFILLIVSLIINLL